MALSLRNQNAYAEQMRDVTVLGSANMDLVVRQSRLPRPGETIFGSEFGTVPGGKGLNQAVAAARAGASVAFVGAVGDDGYGTELRALLDAEGIDTAALATVPGSSGTAHISVVDGGENSIVVVPGANGEVRELTPAARAAVTSCRFLVLQFELPQPVLLDAARLARAAGATVVLTPAPVQPPLPGLLELVGLLLCNEGEALELSGLDDPADAALALSAHGATVVVTRGAASALVAELGRALPEVPARRADAVDTTAAGDCFAGVLVARLAAGAAAEVALAAAAAAASLSVTRPGASASMPTWTEIAARL